MGYLANYSPSPFGEGRGEAISLTLSYPMNSFPTSQTQRGISLFTPLSLRRGVGGEAASGVFQAVFIPLLPSERVGERLLRASVQATFL